VGELMSHARCARLATMSVRGFAAPMATSAAAAFGDIPPQDARLPGHAATGQTSCSEATKLTKSSVDSELSQRFEPKTRSSSGC
jgi:hypothetical protein